MRKRRNASLRLESMEERVVPSLLGWNVPPAVTADFHKMGHAINGYAKGFKNYLETVNQHRSGQSVRAQWATGSSAAHHASDTLFGIPWLKI
jgi:hypothetical protein